MHTLDPHARGLGLSSAEAAIQAHVFGRRQTNAFFMPSLIGNQVLTFLDFYAQGSNPPAPPAGVLRFHSATTQGFTRFEQDNEAATNLVLGRDNVFIAKNTSGSDMTAGVAVYVTGSTGNVPNISLAKADAASTLPSVGLTLDAITNNHFGQVMRLGIIGIDTSAFSTGALLYVSKDTAGALTATRPVSPNLVQAMAVVLVAGVGNGSMFVITAPFIGGVESGTTSIYYTPKDIVNTDSTKGLVLKDNAGTPHYWRVQVSTLGALTTTDLGTTLPT